MAIGNQDGVLDRALRSLPPVAAPATLLPRVMAAIGAWSERPWYERAWFTWPRGWQVASAMQSMLAVASQDATASIFARLSGGFDRVDATVSGARVLWRALAAPVLAYAAIVVLLMYGACAAVVVVINRAFFGKVMPQS